eukprot:4688955-Pleurochrysis_carterae.AAC.1
MTICDQTERRVWKNKPRQCRSVYHHRKSSGYSKQKGMMGTLSWVRERCVRLKGQGYVRYSGLVFNTPPCEAPGDEHQRATFMVVSRIAKNTRGGSGIVKKSAMLHALATNGTEMSWVSTRSRTKK